MTPRLLTLLLAAALAACDSRESPARDHSAPAANGQRILPVAPGDSWTYEVTLEIPAGVTSEAAAAVYTRHRRTRTYLGKISAAEGLPETDCFQVVVPGSPDEREFVEIHDDRILMRGSLIMRPETTRPLWLDTPVLFVSSDMKPGTSLPPFATADGALARSTRVIAREDVTVPAGTFPCVRLLTTGHDGDVELRRTVWFAHGKGIIREEKTRYRQNKLLFREIQQLVETRGAAG